MAGRDRVFPFRRGDRMVDFGFGIFGVNTWVCARADPDPDLRLSVAAQIARCCAWVEHGCGHFGGLDGRALGGSTAVPNAPHGHPFSVAYFERDDVGVDD